MQHEVLGRRQVSLLPLRRLTVFPALLLAACSAPAKETVVVLPAAADPPQLVETVPTAEPTAEPAKKPTAIAWQTSEEKARALAKSRRLALVVFVFAAWATPAVTMDRVTWSDARVLDRATSFVALRLDVSDADAQAQADADRHDIRTMPSTLIFDPDGTEIGRLEGFASAEDVLGVLDTVAPLAD